MEVEIPWSVNIIIKYMIGNNCQLTIKRQYNNLRVYQFILSNNLFLIFSWWYLDSLDVDLYGDLLAVDLNQEMTYPEVKISKNYFKRLGSFLYWICCYLNKWLDYSVEPISVQCLDLVLKWIMYFGCVSTHFRFRPPSCIGYGNCGRLRQGNICRGSRHEVGKCARGEG